MTDYLFKQLPYLSPYHLMKMNFTAISAAVTKAIPIIVTTSALLVLFTHKDVR